MQQRSNSELGAALTEASSGLLPCHFYVLDLSRCRSILVILKSPEALHDSSTEDLLLGLAACHAPSCVLWSY